MSRRALVTGGSGAIGAAICRRLAADGCEVLIHAHRGLEAAEALACELRSGGSVAQVLAFDVTDAEACRQALVTALAGGPVQVLVNNAGIHDDAVLAGMRTEQWHHVIDVSVDGFFHVTQPLLLPMLRTRWGRIISIGSVAGLAGNRGQVNYAAAKGALHAATRALSLEVASRGITDNAVAPGIIATPMSAGSFDAAAIERLVPARRAGRPEEVADLVGFLASEQAAYISGQIISVNGGLY